MRHVARVRVAVIVRVRVRVRVMIVVRLHRAVVMHQEDADQPEGDEEAGQDPGRHEVDGRCLEERVRRPERQARREAGALELGSRRTVEQECISSTCQVSGSITRPPHPVSTKKPDGVCV